MIVFLSVFFNETNSLNLSNLGFSNQKLYFLYKRVVEKGSFSKTNFFKKRKAIVFENNSFFKKLLRFQKQSFFKMTV